MGWGPWQDWHSRKRAQKATLRASRAASPQTVHKGFKTRRTKKHLQLCSQSLFCLVRPNTVSGPRARPRYTRDAPGAPDTTKSEATRHGTDASATHKNSTPCPATLRLSRRAFMPSQKISPPLPPIHFSLSPSLLSLIHGAADRPQKMAREAATKPSGNETKGPNAPFVKPRKAPVARKKPEGWTNDRWNQDCLRRKLSMTERGGMAGGAA
jgi:hypothetical protein